MSRTYQNFITRPLSAQNKILNYLLPNLASQSIFQSMLFFGGDMPHAGAKYFNENCLLFLSVSSDKFPFTDDVHIVK